jgi:hypothetical protein
VQGQLEQVVEEETAPDAASNAMVRSRTQSAAARHEVAVAARRRGSLVGDEHATAISDANAGALDR